MASFWSSLVGSYSDAMLKKHQAAKAEEVNSAKAQLDTLVNAAVNGQVKPEYMDSVKEQINELQEEIAGKKSKGGFHISNLIGKFQDVGGQTQPGASKATQTKGGGGGQSGGGNVSGAAAAPAAPPNVGQPPTRPSAGVGQPPTRESVPRGTFGESVTKGLKTSQELTHEEIDKTKAVLAAKSDADKQAVKDAASEYQKTHPEATPREVYDKVIGPMTTGIKGDDEAVAREQIKEQFSTLREQNRQQFQLSLEQMRSKAADRRQAGHDEMMMRALGARMSRQDRERMKITPAQINQEINGSLTSMRQQLAQASKSLQAATKAAQDKSGSPLKWFKDDPDVAGAQQDVRNLQAAIAHIERNRGAIISGKADLDDIIDQAQSIMIGGSDVVPPGAETGPTIDLRPK